MRRAARGADGLVLDMMVPRPTYRLTVRVPLSCAHLVNWLLLVLLIGGHWGMLQVVAWTGMLIDYSRDNTFVEAIGMTFSGEYRCSICQQVDDGIAADLGDDRKAPGKVAKTVKLDAVVLAVVVTIPAPIVQSLPATRSDAVADGITWEPLRRPPRLQG